MSSIPNVPQSQQVEGRPSPFSPWILNAGFVLGLFLAFLCLLGGVGYLYVYFQDARHSVKEIVEQKEAPESVKIMAIHARNIQARLSLQACGVFVGMAFGFLGFSLFLLGISDSMEFEGGASVGTGANVGMSGATAKASRLLPGVAVLAAATILVAVSVTHTTSYTFTTPYLTTEKGKTPPGTPSIPTSPTPEDEGSGAGGKPKPGKGKG